MTNNYHPIVNSTIRFLRLLEVKVNTSTVNKSLHDHPDWPSLLSISDALNSWNISNGAGKIKPNDIDLLPVPFIIETGDSEAPLMVVNRITDTHISAYHENHKHAIHIDKKNFLSKWNGIYLFAEINEHSGEPNYNVNRRKFIYDLILKISPIVAFLLLVFLIIYNAVFTSQSANLRFGVYLQSSIMIVGTIVTSILISYEINKDSFIVKKVCGASKNKTKCSAILSSKGAKLFGWLSWSEIGFFYFSGGLLTILFSGNDPSSSIILVGMVNILAFPYIFYSLYYQWSIARQWCMLCITVQLLLVVGCVNVIVNEFVFLYSKVTYLLIIQAFLLYLIPILIWYTVKPLLLQLQQSVHVNRQYLRLKFNTDIFNDYLKKQKPINVPTDDLGVILGNEQAKNTLITVCNTYCEPCSNAHSKIYELLKLNPDIKVKVIFTASDNVSDITARPARHLLAIAEKGNLDILTKAMDDWFLSKSKSYERFAVLYPMDGELLTQNEKLKKMHQWCDAMKITHTPTFFLNGYELPDTYKIEDLKYLLKEN